MISEDGFRFSPYQRDFINSDVNLFKNLFLSTCHGGGKTVALLGKSLAHAEKGETIDFFTSNMVEVGRILDICSDVLQFTNVEIDERDKKLIIGNGRVFLKTPTSYAGTRVSQNIFIDDIDLIDENFLDNAIRQVKIVGTFNEKNISILGKFKEYILLDIIHADLYNVITFGRVDKSA